MLITLGILSILLPIYAGWKVWKHLTSQTHPDDPDSIGTLVRQVAYSAGTTFGLLLICFYALSLLGSPQ